MLFRKSLFLLFGLLVLLAPSARAAGDGEPFDAMSHAADGNYLDFSPFALVELPRIIVTKNADGGYGFEVYGSTKGALDSGNYDAVKKDGEVLHGEHLADQHHYLHSKIKRKEGSIALDLSITRHLLFMWLGVGLLLWIMLSVAGKYKKGIGRTSAPKGFLQNAIEVMVLFIRDEVAKPNIPAKYVDKYLPYLLSVFFTILFCNILGMIPFGATATSNIAITAVLAIFTFIVVQVGGTKDYWMHLINPPGVPGFVKVLLVPVEILGLFIKPFALAVRLFANMTAGHLIILNFIGLIFIFGGKFGAGLGYGVAPISIGMAVFIYLIECLVVFIQAYVFTMLSAVFIGQAKEEHEHH